MHLVGSEQEADLTAMLRDLFAAECPVELVRRLAEPNADRRPGSLWRALADAGVLGLAFGEEHGGAGGELTDLGVVLVEAGRVLCPTVLHSTLAFGLVVDRFGSAAQRNRWLPPLCAGDLCGTVALGDPGDAADLRPAVRAEPAAAGYRLRGAVEFVADVDLADALLVTATAAEPGEPARVIAATVRPGAAGVRVTDLPTTGPERLFRVEFDDVAVPADDVLTDGGIPDTELRRLANVLVTLRCLDIVGGAEAVLRRTVEYTTARHQFGRPIGSFQAAQHLVADMHIGLTAARLAARSALFWLGRGRPANRETAIARMHAATAGKRITLDAHQLHGGMGYVVETDLHLWSERARAFATLDGGAAVAASWLRREVGLG